MTPEVKYSPPESPRSALLLYTDYLLTMAEGWQKEVTPNDWNNFAVRYKQVSEEMGQMPVHDLLKAVDTASPFSQTKAFLDLGCGTGNVISNLLQQYGNVLPQDAKLAALDLSPGMLAEVQKDKEAHAAKGDGNWAKLLIGPVDAMDMKAMSEGAYSHVLSAFVLFLLPDPQQGLREILRILSENGVLAITTWITNEMLELTYIVEKVRPDIRMPRMPEQWTSTAGVKSQLETAGYQIIDIFQSEMQLKVSDPVEFVENFILNMPPLLKPLQALSGDERMKVKQLMIKELQDNHPTWPAALGGTSIVGIGRK